MKRYFVIVIILFLLAGALVWEQIFINQSIDILKEKSQEVYEIVTTSENISSQSVLRKVEDLNNFWTKRESELCLVINHKDMEKVGEQITKLYSLCEQNDISQANIEVDLLKYYVDGYEHIMRLTFQNIW